MAVSSVFQRHPSLTPEHYSLPLGESKLPTMQQTIQISTPAHNGLYDITRQVEAIVKESGVKSGLVNVYVQGATAGIMIQFKFIDSLKSLRYRVPCILQMLLQ
jgi:hypothetical protein